MGNSRMKQVKSFGPFRNNENKNENEDEKGM